MGLVSLSGPINVTFVLQVVTIENTNTTNNKQKGDTEFHVTNSTKGQRSFYIRTHTICTV